MSESEAEGLGFIRVTEPYNLTQAKDEEFLHRFVWDLRMDRRIEYLVIRDERFRDLVTVWRKKVKVRKAR